MASDQKRLIVDALQRFKIVIPLKFYISVENERVQRSRLSQLLTQELEACRVLKTFKLYYLRIEINKWHLLQKV